MLTVKDPSKVEWAKLSLHDIAVGNSADVYYTLKLHEDMWPIIKSLKVDTFYEKIMSPLTTYFARAEYRGLDVDIEQLEKLKVQLEKDIALSLDTIYSLSKVPKDINVNSGAQIADLLYLSTEGYQLYPPMKTKKDEPSTSKDCLDEIKELIEIELKRRNEKSKR